MTTYQEHRMANANARPLAPTETPPQPSAEWMLTQLAALLDRAAETTPTMMRVRIRAIYEGVDVPDERKAFIALVKRAGCCWRSGYKAFTDEYGQSPTGPVAVRLYDEDGHAYWVEPSEPQPDPELQPEPEAEPEPDGRERPTALYRYYDISDLLLYVGISGRLYDRTGDHTKGSSWMDFAVRSTIERFPARDEAVEAEEAAIKAEHPLFNDRHNNTPEARRQLVEYLVRHDRLDLLAPAVSRG